MPSPEVQALVSLKEGESLLLPRRKNDSHGGWTHFARAIRHRGLTVVQRREGDFMRFWTAPI